MATRTLNNTFHIMKNFKSTVPAILAERIKKLAETIDFSEIVSGRMESVSEQMLREIEGNHVSGWLPRQDGGFAVDQFYSSDIDSYHFTEKQTEFIEEQREQCFESFLLDYGIEEDDGLTDEQKESFYEYENEWFAEPALLSFEVFCNGYADLIGEEKTVTIRLSINYKDAPYYREKYAEDIKSETLTVDEFLSESIADIIERFKI